MSDITSHASIKRLRGRVSQLEDRQSKLEKSVREIRNDIQIRDNWNAEVRTLIGADVAILAISGREYYGKLLWVDRYNLCIHGNDVGTFDKHRITLQKGGIESIRKSDSEVK